MAEISLTDGLCRIAFDSSTVEGLEIIHAGPAIIYIKSEERAFASIGLEYLKIEDLHTGTDLKDKGLRHFLSLIHNLDTSNWIYKGIDVKGLIAQGSNWIMGDKDWHYALFNREGSEAICAFCKIDDDHICSVVSIFHEGENMKITKIVDLIKSIRGSSL